MRKLSDLHAGEEAYIERVDADVKTKRRLSEMGVLKGAKVRFLCRAPLGDPLAIDLNGFRIALRAKAADGISIKGESV